MMEGWIKFHRKFVKWEWFKTPHMFHLFGYLLMMACHEDTKWKGIVLKRGQVVTGRKSLSVSTGISARSLRTCIERLKSTSEITIKTTNQYSIITITNYDYYNDNINKTTSETTSETTNDRPATDQRPTTYKNDKKDKKDFKENYIKENFSNPEEDLEEREKRRLGFINSLFMEEETEDLTKK